MKFRRTSRPRELRGGISPAVSPKTDGRKQRVFKTADDIRRAVRDATDAMGMVTVFDAVTGEPRRLWPVDAVSAIERGVATL